MPKSIVTINGKQVMKLVLPKKRKNQEAAKYRERIYAHEQRKKLIQHLDMKHKLNEP